MRFDDIKESSLMAIDTLRANKLRSSLTILGVSVGVITIIFMVSIIQGLNKAFADQVESLGSNTIFVSKFDPGFGRPPGPSEIHRKDLTMEDAEALREGAINRRCLTDPSIDCRDDALSEQANGHAYPPGRHSLL